MKEFMVGEYRHLQFVCRHLLNNKIFAKVENVRAGIKGFYSRLIVDENQLAEAIMVVEAYKRDISWQSEKLKVQYASDFGTIEDSQEEWG